MNFMRATLIVGVVALASTAAVAFQEQTQGVPGKSAAPVPALTSPLGVSPIEGAPSGRSAGGTEIRVPGFGRLGVIPRLDFGMELLYGSGDTKAPAPATNPDDSDSLAIRGSVKHKF